MRAKTVSTAEPVVDSPQAVEAVRGLARVARVVERASVELSLAHYRVLAAIDSGGERASRIAVKLSLGKPTVSQNIDALCRRGLITRSTATDHRVSVLALTGEGRAVLARVEQAMIAEVGELCARTDNPRAIIDALAALGAAAEAAADERASRSTTAPVRNA